MSVYAERKIILLGQQSLQNSLLLELFKSKHRYLCTLQNNFPKQKSLSLKLPILILIDILAFPIDPGIDYIDDMTQLADKEWIAFLNMRHDADYEYLLEFEGLKGIFFRDATQEQLLKGINAIFEGDCWFSRRLMTSFLTKHRQVSKRLNGCKPHLTKQELTILHFVAEGETNEAIAKRLYLSVHTIKTHVYHIFRKIGVSNRIQAVNWMTDKKSVLEDNSLANRLQKTDNV